MGVCNGWMGREREREKCVVFVVGSDDSVSFISVGCFVYRVRERQRCHKTDTSIVKRTFEM